MSGGHCFRDTWHIFSGMLRGSFTSAGESSVPLWGVEGGESHGRPAPGDPELLKKADISLMYFTEAEWEGVGDKRKGRRSKRGQRREREKKCKNEASRFGDELKVVTLKNCFKVVQKSTHSAKSSMSQRFSHTEPMMFMLHFCCR